MGTKLWLTAIWAAVVFGVVVNLVGLKEWPTGRASIPDEAGHVFMRDPSGEIVALPKDQEAQAFAEGYRSGPTRADFVKAGDMLTADRRVEWAAWMLAAWLPLAAVMAVRKWLGWLRVGEPARRHA